MNDTRETSNKRKSKLSKKFKVMIENQKQYKILGSKQFLGILLVFVFTFLMIVSMIQIRGLSTINSYTIWMLFGHYSYFIYVGFIILGLCYLFQIDTKIDKYLSMKFNRKFYFSWFSYLIFCIGFALIIESISMLVEKKDPFPGLNSFKQFFEDWWTSFSNGNGKNPNSTAWLPGTDNSGIIISFFMSIIVCWSGLFVSTIIGVLFVGYFVLYIFYGSIIKIIRTKIFGDPTKKEISKREDIKNHKTKMLDLSFEDNGGFTNEISYGRKRQTSSTNSVELNLKDANNDFPISNPYEEIDNEKNNNSVELQEKTKQINLKNKKTKEFVLDDNKIKKEWEELNRSKTFDFELDIFDDTNEDAIN